MELAKVPIGHIDGLAAEVDACSPVQVELIGNIKETLKIMNTFDYTTTR